ncbi:hypothetical protein NQ315_011707 [Exocentrus adspersus]|uniref:Uncharacterized protein n=1 Tax=Exocentrus adspersus TaxID=1586481 RepID=A0AAV8W149_9CUCU|nr:hypothetical protein NQ315_011707 [Exocentrus adspersus]
MDVEAKPAQPEPEAKPVDEMAPPETNGSVIESPKHNTRSKKGQRRSRSRTPQKKNDDSKLLHVTLKKLDTELNGKEVQEPAEGPNPEPEKVTEEAASEDKFNGEGEISFNNEELNKSSTSNGEEKKETPKKPEPPKKSTPRKGKGKTDGTQVDAETVEMDPLVITDEPDPELQFDENSDLESGKGSPVISRCMTRRSQTRNIPTPKTPKLVDQEADSEKETDLNDSCEYMDSINYSTTVEVGSDATRLDYIEHHDLEDSSYINSSREKSLSETLRGLSARRPIRPLNDYRTRVLRSNQEKAGLNASYSSFAGVKRKSRSSSPEERKKFRTDSPGLNSLFSSPLANIRNRFKSDLPSSTPKLLGYRDTGGEMHYNADFENGDDEKKSWCSIM